jgi:hypothetical protein
MMWWNQSLVAPAIFVVTDPFVVWQELTTRVMSLRRQQQRHIQEQQRTRDPRAKPRGAQVAVTPIVVRERLDVCE